MQSPTPHSRFVALPSSTALNHMLAQAQDALLRHALVAQSTIDMAKGALVVLGSVPLDRTPQVLADLARTLGMEVHTVAGHVLSLVQGRAVPDTLADELHRALARSRT